MLNYLKNLFLTSLSLFSTAAGDLISTSNWPNEKWLINLNIRYGEHSISAWSELNIEMMKFSFDSKQNKSWILFYSFCENFTFINALFESVPTSFVLMVI